MANQQYSATIIPLETITSSSENASFPDDNVKWIGYPFRPWKATAASSEWVKSAFASNISPEACFIDNVNSTQIKLQGHTDDVSWGGAIDYDQTIAVSEDPVSGRRKVFHDIVGTPSLDFWRVINDGSITDGSGVFQVGSWSFWDTLVTTDSNFGFPYTEEFAEPTLGLGTGEPVTVGNKSAIIVLNTADYPTSSTMASELRTLFRVSYSTPIVWYKNDSDTSQGYICHRTAQHSLSKTNPQKHNFRQIVLREVGSII